MLDVVPGVVTDEIELLSSEVRPVAVVFTGQRNSRPAFAAAAAASALVTLFGGQLIAVIGGELFVLQLVVSICSEAVPRSILVGIDAVASAVGTPSETVAASGVMGATSAKASASSATTSTTMTTSASSV